jgi:hypothetical protein
MRVARIKSMLWVITAAAAAGTIIVIIAAATLPFGSSADAPLQPAGGAPTEVTTGQALAIPPLASFEAAWSLPLRRPLVEAPAPALAATDAPVKPAGLALRLVGTIIDGQHPRGLFMIGLTKVELKGVGDAVAGARVVAIDSDAATLSYEGKTLIFHREKAPFDPTGESYNATALPNAPGNDPAGPSGGGS